MRSLITSRGRFAAIAAFFVALAVFPQFDQDFYTELVTRTMILAIFAISLDLLLGYTGLISFGHAAWFGIGGYVLALLGTQYQVTNSLWLTPPAAMAMPEGCTAVRTAAVSPRAAAAVALPVLDVVGLAPPRRSIAPGPAASAVRRLRRVSARCGPAA